MNLFHEKISADVVVVDVHSITEIKGYAMSRDTGWILTINSYARNCTVFGRRCAMQINRCPKCGRMPVILIARNNDDSESIYGYKAECYDCDMRSDVGGTKAEAVAKGK